MSKIIDSLTATATLETAAQAFVEASQPQLCEFATNIGIASEP